MGMYIRASIAIATLFVAFYAYNPLPPDIEEPFRYSLRLTRLRLIEDISKAAEVLGICDMRIARRKLIGLFFSPGKAPEGLIILDTVFDGVKVRLYRSEDVSNEILRKGFVFVHGGGFVSGSVDSGHHELAKIAKDTGTVVVSVEYRLSPEHPSPAALEDCYTASRYFFSHAHEWGVDPQQIGVGGASAGGNMAAVLALKYRDEGREPQFAYQILIYPWMQALDFRLPSYKEENVYMPPDMTQKGMVLYTVSYIGIDRRHIPKFQENKHITKATRLHYSKLIKPESLAGYEEEEAEGDPVLASEVEPLILNPYNFPLMAESLKDLPPAFVLTMGIDTIRDDGLLYAQRLRDAGVDLQHYHDDLCWHGVFVVVTGDTGFLCGVRLLDAVIKYINER